MMAILFFEREYSPFAEKKRTSSGVRFGFILNDHISKIYEIEWKLNITFYRNLHSIKYSYNAGKLDYDCRIFAIARVKRTHSTARRR